MNHEVTGLPRAGDTTRERTSPWPYLEEREGKSSEDGVTTHVDPVCGMPVTKESGVLLEDETNRDLYHGQLRTPSSTSSSSGPAAGLLLACDER